MAEEQGARDTEKLTAWLEVVEGRQATSKNPLPSDPGRFHLSGIFSDLPHFRQRDRPVFPG